MTLEQEYKKRINRVIQYIEDHFSEKLTIDELAQVANYSKYHFNRVFRLVTRESVYSFIKRIRLERANSSLWRSGYSISEIAQRCGFASASNFSYNYKKHYGISAKEQLANFNAFKEQSDIPGINVNIRKSLTGKVAYIKVIGKMNDSLYDDMKTLYSWAEARDLWTCDSRFIFIIYDSHYVTSKENIRCDICLTVPDEIHSDGVVNIMDLTEEKIAVTSVFCVPRIPIINKVYDELANWALSSNYQIDGYQYIYFPKGVVPVSESLCDFEILSPVRLR